MSRLFGDKELPLDGDEWRRALMSIGDDVVRARWVRGDINELALDNEEERLVWEALVEYLELTELSSDVFVELDRDT